MSVINTRGFCRFWPVSWTITHIFGVPKQFAWMSNPKVRLRIGHQQSQFRLILARFLDYYSVLGQRSHFHDQRTPVCLCVGRQQSQFWPILARFLDYYSVLWSRSDFHDRRTTVCSCVCHQHLQFWPSLARFMDYYSLISGP